MATKNNPGAYDCYAKAHPDEPMFVLLGRDQSAALLVRLWALVRHGRVESGARPPSDAEKVAEALKCADDMEAYCKKMGRYPFHVWPHGKTAEALLLEITKGLKQHPEGYEHPCACQLCLSYAGEGHAIHVPGVSPQPNHIGVDDIGSGP